MHYSWTSSILSYVKILITGKDVHTQKFYGGPAGEAEFSCKDISSSICVSVTIKKNLSWVRATISSP